MSDLISKRLLRWYAQHARVLPWRGSKEPYAVWVSEIMLQQTRVETVVPYYDRWMARFPSLQSLASADQQEVLALWEGLGYYSRARNLHRAAQIIQEKLSGVFPSDQAGLEKLPGVGRYTAAAIASIAFGADSPALDGNIRRVYSRCFNVTEPARSPEGERLLWKLAQQQLPTGQAGDFNQALMDLGALVCLPRSPQCPSCPLADLCQARALGVQAERPVTSAKPVAPHYQVAAAIILQNGPPARGNGSTMEVLLARRPQQGLLGGLWEYPGGKQQEGEDLPACLQREIIEELGVSVRVGAEYGVYRHAYTHFKVTLHAFVCEIVSGEAQPIQPSELRWTPLQELGSFPMGKIDRLISQQLAGAPPDSLHDRD